MSLLLYGMVADGDEVEDRLKKATDDAGLLFIHAGGLVAVAAPCEQADQEVESVLAFGKLIDRIHRQTTIIPIRYGTLLPDAAAITAYLSAMASHYLSRLIALAGCDEMGVRLPLAGSFVERAPPGSISSGRDYLQSLRSKYSATEQAEQQADALNRALAGLYREQRGEAGLFNGEPRYLVSYLVPRTTLSAFREKLDQSAIPGMGPGLISGPWPPYNFT